MSTISDGINAKILAALAKIPEQIQQSLNQALPDQLASALTDSLFAVNQRLEELETTTNNLRNELKDKTEHLQSKINDMTFHQKMHRAQATIDQASSCLRISNVLQLCKIDPAELHEAGFYASELVCSKFDNLLDEIGAYRLWCESAQFLNGHLKETAIVRFSSPLKAHRAKMMLVRYLSSEAGKQIRCSVDVSLPITHVFKRIERPVRQLMEALKIGKHIRAFHIDSVVNHNRTSAEAGSIRPRVGVVLGDGRRIRNVVPESVAYLDGVHSSSHRLILTALKKDIPEINVEAILEIAANKEKRAADRTAERKNTNSKNRSNRRPASGGQAPSAAVSDTAEVMEVSPPSPAKRSSSRSSDDSLEPPTQKPRAATPAVSHGTSSE